MQIRLVARPVIYNHENREGPGELHAPDMGWDSMLIPAGGTVIAAWWCPEGPMHHLAAFDGIAVEPSGTSVNLSAAGGINKPDARIRIQIFAAIE